MADQLFTVLEQSYRDYLPFTRIGSPIFDDLLSRNLKAVFPMTEYGSSHIDDPIQGGNVSLESGAFTWRPDGGVFIGSSSTHLRNYSQAVIPNLPITVSSWHRKIAGSTQAGLAYYFQGPSGFDALDLRTSPLGGGDQFALQYYAGTPELTQTTSSIVTTEWSLLTIVCAESYRAIYFNGRREGQTILSKPQGAAFLTFTLFGLSGYGYQNGGMRDLRIWSRALDDREVFELYARGYARRDSEVFRPRLFPIIWDKPLGPTLVADFGTFALTGQAAALSRTRLLEADSAMFSFSGQATSSIHLRRLAADAGAYSFSGQDTTLNKGRMLTADHASYGLSGQDAAFNRARALAADVGTFNFAGSNINFISTRVLDAQLGIYAILGQNAELNIGSIFDLTTSFHGALANWLYPNMLERERLALFGAFSQAELISVTPTGEEVIYTLTEGPWSARRIPTIESGGDEQWRLEIAGDLVDWNELASVTKVRMRGAIDEEQVYEVLDRYNAMKPGRVYQLRMQAKANIDPS